MVEKKSPKLKNFRKNRKSEKSKNRKILRISIENFRNIENPKIPKFENSKNFNWNPSKIFRFSKFSIFRFFENFSTSAIFFDQNLCEFFTDFFLNRCFFILRFRKVRREIENAMPWRERAMSEAIRGYPRSYTPFVLIPPFGLQVTEIR